MTSIVSGCAVQAQHPRISMVVFFNQTKSDSSTSYMYQAGKTQTRIFRCIQVTIWSCPHRCKRPWEFIFVLVCLRFWYSYMETDIFEALTHTIKAIQNLSTVTQSKWSYISVQLLLMNEGLIKWQRSNVNIIADVTISPSSRIQPFEIQENSWSKSKLKLEHSVVNRRNVESYITMFEYLQLAF